MSRKAPGMLAIVVLSVLLGALREFLFINLNYQLDFLAHNREVSYAHSMFQRWVAGLEHGDLTALKWLLSMLFIFLMLVLAILLSRLLTGHFKHAPLLITGYVVLSLLSLLFNRLSNGDDAWYTISVRLLHALQYPVILLFVWAASTLATHRR